MRREEIEARAACYECGLSYSDAAFQDLVVPDDAWLKISPTGDDGGLICPNCMCRRAHEAGLEGVPARFTSGPFADRSAYNAGLERAAEIAEGLEKSRDWAPGSFYDTLRRETAAAIRAGLKEACSTK